ncbi:MAG: hypothetical protein V4760_05555 [Bdellovibrionota bacterium]
MKKTVTTLLIGMMSVQAVAQQAVIVGGGNGTTLANVQAGKYDFSNLSQDSTAIALKAMDQAGVTRDLDRKFIQELSDRMSRKVQELVTLGTKMNALSVKSVGAGVSFESEYFPLLNEIRTKNAQLQAELEISTSISPEVLPSYEPIQVGGLSISAPATTKINLGPVVEKIDNARRTIIDSINATKLVRVITASGAQVIFNGNDTLSPDLSRLQLLSPEQVAEMQKKIRVYSQLSTSTTRLNQQFVNAIVPMINNFVRNYGTEERFRFRDENDAKARAQALDQITDAFYRRSYLRKKFGISMGAIQPDPVKGYPKSIANLEKFGLVSVTKALSSYSTQPAQLDTEIMTAFETTRNFVQQYDEKLTPVFKSKQKIVAIKTTRGETKQVSMDSDYMSKDTGFLVRANSAITFLTGSQPTAEVMLAVMRMVLADIKEEMLLLQNDRASLANYHDMRFRATPALKDLANLRMCQFDISIPQAAFDQACATLKGKTVGGTVMRDQAGNIVMEAGKPKVVGAITVTMIQRPSLQTGAVAGSISHTTLTWISNFTTVEKKNRDMVENLQKQIEMASEGALTDEQRQQKIDEALELFN